MTRYTFKDWVPERDLQAVLDALADELLAAPDHEVSACFSDANERRDEVETARRLIAAADAGAAPPPASLFKSPGLRAYLDRNQ